VADRAARPSAAGEYHGLRATWLVQAVASPGSRPRASGPEACPRTQGVRAPPTFQIVRLVATFVRTQGRVPEPGRAPRGSPAERKASAGTLRGQRLLTDSTGSHVMVGGSGTSADLGGSAPWLVRGTVVQSLGPLDSRANPDRKAGGGGICQELGPAWRQCALSRSRDRGGDHAKGTEPNDRT